MAIRILVLVLALVAFSVFFSGGPLQAYSAYSRVVSTNPDLRFAKYRVLTTGSVVSGSTSDRDLDNFRAIFDGIVFQDGDQLSFTFEGADGKVDIGSPTFTGSGASLTLANNKAKGTLGVSPYDYPKAKIKFNRRRNRLTFFSGSGRAQAVPVITPTPSQGSATTTESVDVVVHIRRSGEADSDATFSRNFEVRHSVKRSSQMHIYRGIAR